MKHYVLTNKQENFCELNDNEIPYEVLVFKLMLDDSDLIYKSNLFERNGIINYDDSKYQHDLLYIENTLLKIISGKEKHTDTHLMIDFPEYGKYKGIYELYTFDNVCNIEQLYILLQKVPIGNEVATILISNKDKEHKLYIQDGCKTLRATIIIKYSLSWFESYRLSGLIEHELKHLFDLNKEYKSDCNKMNKDALIIESFYEFINKERKYNGWLYSKFDKTIAHPDILIDINKQYKAKYYINCTLVLPFIADMLYYLNKSEISARLTQVKWKDDMTQIIDLYTQFYVKILLIILMIMLKNI